MTTAEKLTTPEIEEITKSSHMVKVSQEQLRAIINRIVPCAAHGRYDKLSIISHVCFSIKDDTLEVCATDGSRLALFTDTVKNSSSDPFKFTVPADWLVELKPVKSKSATIDLVVNKETGKVSAYKDLQFLSKCESENYANSYPRYQELIPTEYKYSIIFLDAEEVIKYASSVAHIGLSLCFDVGIDGFANVSLVKHEFLSMTATTKVHSDSNLTVSFYSSRLIEALYTQSKSKNKTYSITARGNGPEKPWIFTDSDPRVKHLLMPVAKK